LNKNKTVSKTKKKLFQSLSPILFQRLRLKCLKHKFKIFQRRTPKLFQRTKPNVFQRIILHMFKD
jgi:hypothetical protein